MSKNNKIKFTHHKQAALKLWQKILIRGVAAPANCFLFIGGTGSLGLLGVWLVQLLASPQPSSEPASTIVLFGNDQTTASLLAIIVLTGTIGLIVCLAAAEATRRAVRWLGNVLRVRAFYSLFEISLLLLCWLPLTTLLTAKNPQHQAQLLAATCSAIIISSILFVTEDLLTRYWSDSSEETH